MKTNILALLLTGSLFVKRILPDVSENIIVGLYCASLSIFAIVAFRTSAHLRARICKLGPFLPYDYFCIGVLLIFIGFLGAAGTLVVSNPAEMKIIIQVLQVTSLVSCILYLLAKKYLKEEKIKNTTYL